MGEGIFGMNHSVASLEGFFGGRDGRNGTLKYMTYFNMYAEGRYLVEKQKPKEQVG